MKAKTRVGVLGSTGMIGGAVAKVLASSNIEVFTIGRNGSDVQFDADSPDFTVLERLDLSYVVNCIGLIPQKVQLEDALSLQRMLRVNSVFPHVLTQWSLGQDNKVIQVATDCVFSGSGGPYFETSLKNANDNYGLSKILGELDSPNLLTLRCSVVGSGLDGSSSLLDWVKSQPINAEIPGFIDRNWNGISSLAFAKVVRGLIASGDFQGGLQHLVPSGFMSKFDLVQLLAQKYSRSDINVKPIKSGNRKDLRLGTIAPQRNKALWEGAGYSSIPTIEELVSELANWETILNPL